MARVRYLGMLGLEALARILPSPPPFAPAILEQAFRFEYARRTAPQRRAGLVLALLLWLAFSGFDFVNTGLPSDDRAVFLTTLSLRVVGTAAIAYGAALGFGPKLLDPDFANPRLYALCTLCYVLVLVLGMVMDLEFPFSYVLDYPGLIVYLMFVLGLLRLPTKMFLAIVVTVLPITAIGLYWSNLVSIRWRHPSSGAPDAPLVFLEHYYVLCSMIYLAAAMFIGHLIAGHLERDARTTFLRERELEQANHTLARSRRDVEEKSRALIAAKDALRAAAERANLDKSKFLADAVHDLSQPMQAVSLLLESVRLALAQNDHLRCATLVEMTAEAAQSARASFRTMLELSRLETGLIKPNLTAFGLSDLVAETAASIRVIAASNGVRFRLRATEQDRALVSSDRDLLARALGNLVANAVKYSDPRKGARQAVLVGVVALPNAVRVDVIDNGIGIAAAKQSEVFKPFVQLHNPEHDRNKGLGLGLSIVNAVIGILPGHRLAMRSVEGRGTRFSLYVPRHRGEPAAPAANNFIARHTLDLSSLFVWYVEDDGITRAATRALLDRLGILTEQAASFEELERQLAFTERAPDLIISDYRLPHDRTAADAIGLFAERWGPNIPVLVVTGDALPVRAEALGTKVEVLRKPASAEDLIAAIERLCVRSPDLPAGGE